MKRPLDLTRRAVTPRGAGDCRPWAAAANARPNPWSAATPIPVTVAPAAMRERAQTFEVGGVVRGQTSATLSSRMMAAVREVLVQPGDRVRTGQVLLRLDDRDVSAAARTPRARAPCRPNAASTPPAASGMPPMPRLALARATHGRIATLHESQVGHAPRSSTRPSRP